MSNCEKCGATADEPPLWCFTKGCTITDAIDKRAREHVAKCPPLTMKLHTCPAGIACADCGCAVKFEYEPTFWKTGLAYGKCINTNCANHNRVFKFPLASVEVEFVEQE